MMVGLASHFFTYQTMDEDISVKFSFRESVVNTKALLERG